MRVILLILIVLSLTGCNTKNIIKLKTFSKGDTDGKTKKISNKITISPKLKNKQFSELHEFKWKNIKVLHNELSKSIIFRNPSLEGNTKEIILNKGESVLVDDLLEELTFSSKIAFFNYLKCAKQGKKFFSIYNNDKKYYKYIYGITLEENIKKDRECKK